MNESSLVSAITQRVVALRPFRITPREDLVLYEAITFPKNPRGGCELYLRRASVFGSVEQTIMNHGVDLLDAEGDILETFGLSVKAFQYLRAKLKFRVEKLDE